MGLYRASMFGRTSTTARVSHGVAFKRSSKYQSSLYELFDGTRPGCEVPDQSDFH